MESTRKLWISHGQAGAIVFSIAATARFFITQEVGNYEKLASSLHMAKVVFLYLPLFVALATSAIEKHLKKTSKNSDAEGCFLVVIKGIPYWMLLAFFVFFLLFPVRV
jgi:hypothetical protein